MSDESPPLRIKPRLKPEGSSDAPAASPAAPASQEGASTPRITLRPKQTGTPPPAAPAAPAESAAPVPPVPPASAPAPERPRLKPRLSLDPPAAAATSASAAPIETPGAPAAPAPSSGGSVPPVETPPPAAASSSGGAEAPKFKLKPKGAEPAPVTLPVVASVPPPPAPEPAAAPEAAPSAPAESAPAAESAPPPPPAAPAPAPAPSAVPKLKISLLRPAEAAAAPGGKPPVIPKVKGRRPNKLILMGGAVAAVLILGGVYFVFLKPEPPPPPPPPKVAVKPKAGTTPAAKAATPADGTAAPAASTAGKLVEKAQGAAGARTAAVDNSDGLLEKRGPADAAEKSAKAAPPPEETIAGSKAIAPGISAPNANVMVAPEASPAFRTWAANAKVGGVFPNRVRAVINSRAVDGGQIIDDALGIVFDSVDQEKKVLVFRDKSGAKVSIKY